MLHFWWVGSGSISRFGRPEDAVFSDILERNGREGWQIRQALDAVRIYNSMFLQSVVEGCDAVVSS